MWCWCNCLPQKETNDNVVAFWTPRSGAHPNMPYHIGYSLSFGDASIPAEKSGMRPILMSAMAISLVAVMLKVLIA